MTIQKEYKITMTGKELADIIELIKALRRGDTYSISEDRYTKLVKSVDAYQDMLAEQGYYDNE